MSRPIRVSALTVLVLAGCIPSIVIGDAPQDTDDATTGLTTSPPDTSTGNPPTTGSTESCGDGQQGPGEACDDGNDEPNDGCDGACGRSGRVEWTREPDDAEAVSDVAVSGQGQIVLSGWSGSQNFLLALSPEGVEQWRQPVGDSGRLYVHSDGRIVLGTGSGTIHCFSPAGLELWAFEQPAQARVFGLAAAGDVLFSAADGDFDDEPSQRIVVRKHRLDTGAALWEVDAGVHSVGEDLAVFGDRAVVVGRAVVLDNSQAMLGVVDGDGHWVSTELAGQSVQLTAQAASIGAGDFVLSGFGSDPDLLLQRRGPDLGQLWSVGDSGTFTTLHVAADSGQRIVVTGYDAADNHSSAVRLYDGSGALQWASVFASPSPELGDHAVAAAFGPDFLVVAGHVLDEVEDATHGRLWVRRFTLD
jgi:cysteine-rich repeat protein